MNIGEIIKAKIIEGENQVRDELLEALKNGNIVLIDYGTDAQVVGYKSSDVLNQFDAYSTFIEEVVKNQYKYTIKKDA